MGSRGVERNGKENWMGHVCVTGVLEQSGDHAVDALGVEFERRFGRIQYKNSMYSLRARNGAADHLIKSLSEVLTPLGIAQEYNAISPTS